MTGDDLCLDCLSADPQEVHRSLTKGQAGAIEKASVPGVAYECRHGDSGVWHVTPLADQFWRRPSSRNAH